MRGLDTGMRVSPKYYYQGEIWFTLCHRVGAMCVVIASAISTVTHIVITADTTEDNLS